MKLVITLLTVFLFLNGCSVKKAGAPTAPPQVENKLFNTAELTGSFCPSTNPVVFLWPTRKDGKSLSYEERSESRSKINQHNDDKATFEKERDAAKTLIDKKYLPGIRGSKAEFKELACYSLCDPEGFFCFPEDDTVTEIDEWKVGETPEEEQLILQCQENQAQRSKTQKLCKKDYSEKVDPLNTKAGDAALALLVEVGNENNFTEDLTKFEYTYKDGKLVINMDFKDLSYSTTPGEDLFPITEANLDLKDGFLTFNIDAMNAEEDNRVYGQFKFDLEFIFTESGFRLDGDFILVNNDKGTEEIGRVSAPMSQAACSKTSVVSRCE